jgi:hypothetical protein
MPLFIFASYGDGALFQTVRFGANKPVRENLAESITPAHAAAPPLNQEPRFLTLAKTHSIFSSSPSPDIH